MREDGDAFARTDIYSYEYNAGMSAGSPSIGTLVETMSRELSSEEVNITNYPSVLFVGHSLGGIVIRKYLLDEYRKPNHGVLSNERVKGIYLFGTPTNGSDIASLASNLSLSPTLRQLWPSDSPDSFLAQLTSDWINEHVGDIVKSGCAYETDGVVSYGIFRKDVVTQSSAAGLCNDAFGGVVGDKDSGADHITMVKPGSIKSPVHLMLRTWYQEKFGDRPLVPADVVFANCEVDP